MGLLAALANEQEAQSADDENDENDADNAFCFHVSLLLSDKITPAIF